MRCEIVLEPKNNLFLYLFAYKVDFIYTRHSPYMLILLLLLQRGPEIWQGKNKFQQKACTIFFHCEQGSTPNEHFRTRKKILIGEFPLFEDFVTTLHKDT